MIDRVHSLRRWIRNEDWREPSSKIYFSSQYGHHKLFGTCLFLDSEKEVI